MWIDSHCHLDASEFDLDIAQVIANAHSVGVEKLILPAVQRSHFASVIELSHRYPGCRYALGIHPLYVPQVQDEDLAELQSLAQSALSDPAFIGIGEIGLDFFVPQLCTTEMRVRQEWVYAEQLKIARNLDLPVILHVRRSQDSVLKYLRRIKVCGGIAHAFNGSLQQAQHFVAMNFKLGFGGAMTFTRALQIRRLATDLPLQSIVLETDAPDIAPAWLHPSRNTPDQVPAIGAVLAQLRGISLAQIAAQTSANVHAALPRLT